MIRNKEITMAEKNRWIKIFKKRPRAGTRLFCFHFAGGGASVFKNWNNLLPAEIELCAVQLPGREDRYNETPLENYHTAIAELIPRIRPLLDKPFIFFCHSMGTIIGFQLALALYKDYNLTPLRCFFSASAAPNNKPLFKKIAHLPEKEFKAEILSFGGIPREVTSSPGLLKIMLPLLRHDFRLIDSFTYEDCDLLHCPLTILGGQDDSNVPPAKLEGWHNVSTEETNIILFRGGHFYLLENMELLVQTVLEQSGISYSFPPVGIYTNEFEYAG